jgi:hypothetical protein
MTERSESGEKIPLSGSLAFRFLARFYHLKIASPKIPIY